MSDFYKEVRKIEDKLGKTLADNNLLFLFKTDRYPITLTVSQDRDVGAQMEIYSNADGNVSSADAVLRLIFKQDALEIQTNSRLVIPDDLLTKIKSLGKKLHYAYLQAFFADVRKKQMDRGEIKNEPAEKAAEPDFGEFLNTEQEAPNEDED